MFYFMVFTSLVYVVSLERNPLIKLSLFIFLLDVNFENLIIGLYVFIIFSTLVKFQEDQRLIAISIKFIFLLDVNFENLTVGLYVFIIFSILAKFQEDQRSITISIKCLNFKFL